MLDLLIINHRYRISDREKLTALHCWAGATARAAAAAATAAPRIAFLKYSRQAAKNFFDESRGFIIAIPKQTCNDFNRRNAQFHFLKKLHILDRKT